MIHDEQWPVARLIPISSATGVEAQERRLASALLAVMQAVPEFARALLKPLGAPGGRVETFIEVPLKFGDRTVRPDGIITVARGTRAWSALVECKTAANPLESAQMNTYLDLARELEFEAVLSISNQYVSSSTEYPIEIERRKLRHVALHHWAWTDILTEAIVQAEHRGVSDPDQAYILNELIRYLSDPRSGAVAFEGMGPSANPIDHAGGLPLILASADCALAHAVERRAKDRRVNRRSSATASRSPLYVPRMVAGPSSHFAQGLWASGRIPGRNDRGGQGGAVGVLTLDETAGTFRTLDASNG